MPATTVGQACQTRRLPRRPGPRPLLWATIVGCALVAAVAQTAGAQSPSPAAAPGAIAQPQQLPAANPASGDQANLEALPVEKTPPGAVRIDPVEDDYRIGSQDLLEIQVFGVQDLKREVRVNGKGLIGMPLIGTVHIAGLTTNEAETLIAGLYRKTYLQNPEVSVFVKEFTRQRFTIEGAVAKPGMYPLKGPTTLLQGLALAGGQGSLSDLSDVVLFRTEDGERRATRLDVNKIRSAEAPDPLLQADDLIVIGRSAGRVAIRDSLLGDIIGIFNPFTYMVPRP